jgi:hypothetical protein
LRGSTTARYREQAEHLQLLAKIETQLRVRARLLEFVGEYRSLADRFEGAKGGAR